MKKGSTRWAVTAVCLSLILVPPLGAEIVDRIVATVNEDIVTLSELQSALNPYRQRIEEVYVGQNREQILDNARKEVLNKLIDDRLIEQEAKRAAITVRDEDVDATIQDVLRRRKMTQQQLQAMLNRDGTSLDQYRKEMRQQMLRMRVMQREIRSTIVVREEEIGAYYSLHRAEYEGNEAVRIAQILIAVPPNADEKTRADLRNEAETVRIALKGGAPFEAVAPKYARGPLAGATGDLGYVERGSMLPEVETVAFLLGRDEVSEVIATPMGFHVIRVIDHRGGGVKSMEKVRSEIREKLEEEKMEKKYQEWIESLRQKAHIEIKP